jgi:predicted nucleic acid-binding protein
VDVYFVDSAFYVALLHGRDSHHAMAAGVQADLARRRSVQLVTTEAVLVEVLTRLSKYGPHYRASTAEFVFRLREDSRLTIVPQTHALFDAGLALFRQRLDKNYSMPDCMSMVVCRQRGITQVLTTDHDFEQEGLSILRV